MYLRMVIEAHRASNMIEAVDIANRARRREPETLRVCPPKRFLPN